MIPKRIVGTTHYLGAPKGWKPETDGDCAHLAVRFNGYVSESAWEPTPAELAALNAGKIDGSTYQGECACLVGTMANVKGCAYNELIVRPNSNRPAEIWFMNLSPGMTPENNGFAATTKDWIEEWIAVHPAPSEGA